MSDLIQITVEDQDGETRQLAIPADINLSLMEALRAADYDILATCGGMALCATCHIQVLEGAEKIGRITAAELDMLDVLPEADDSSRLSCQIRLSPSLDGIKIRIFGNN